VKPSLTTPFFRGVSEHVTDCITSAWAQVSGRTLRLSQPLTTALFPGARTENVATKAAHVRFTLTDEAGRCYGMALVFKRYNTGCGAGLFRLCDETRAASHRKSGVE
jgi:hypothetical protein